MSCIVNYYVTCFVKFTCGLMIIVIITIIQLDNCDELKLKWMDSIKNIVDFEEVGRQSGEHWVRSGQREPQSESAPTTPTVRTYLEKIDDQQINLKNKYNGLKTDEDANIDEMQYKKKTKKMKEASDEWEQLNKNGPLGMLKSEDMTDNKYNTTTASTSCSSITGSTTSPRTTGLLSIS
mmetsp:Transcript_14132/g.37440  ORF Transcript_14132/g.37440 Transcript_14132/m.37440 type:complete len:179 (-) Transcript_14132:199-735(-)